MLFLNAIRLLLEDFKNVYKIMLYRFVVGVIAAALCCAMVLPQILEIINGDSAKHLLLGVREFISAFFSADAKSLDVAKEIIVGSSKQIMTLLAEKATGFTLAAIGCIIVYLLRRFADTVCYFTVGSTLDDKMTAYASTPFFSAFVANLGKASLYALIYVPVVFIFDAITIGLTLLLFSVSGILMAMFFSVTFIVLTQALKLTFTGIWMPAMTSGKPLRKAIKSGKGFAKQQVKMYATYLATVYVVIILNIVAAFCTFGISLLLTIPMTFFFFICLQYVYYYTIKGKKYFLSYDRISSNPHHGDCEHIFDYINEKDLPSIPNIEEEKK